MSTRALIAVPKEDGIHYVYCHHDGYPSGLGAVLRDHYNSLESACSILDLGNLSGLETTLEASDFYHRDCGTAYCYIWDLINNCWTYHATNGDRTERSL